VRRPCRGSDTYHVRPLAYARGRVKRWTLAALLCVVIVTAAVAAMATSACLSDGSARASRPETAPKAVLRMPIAQDSAEPQPQVVSAPAKLREEAPDGAEEEHDYLWPVDGWIVQGMWAGHPSGIDIGANTGDPIWAVRDGTVIFVGGDPCCSYGNFVIIQHDHGMSSLYGHMSAFAVTLGQEVKQGDLIGRVGMTGKADGPHVHFELRSNGGVVDPLAYLWPRRSAPPPPPFVAAPSQDDGPAAPPPASAPEPAPKDTGTSISAGGRGLRDRCRVVQRDSDGPELDRELQRHPAGLLRYGRLRLDADGLRALAAGPRHLDLPVTGIRPARSPRVVRPPPVCHIVSTRQLVRRVSRGPRERGCATGYQS